MFELDPLISDIIRSDLLGQLFGRNAVARTVKRCQEGLLALVTVRAFTTIYFPAQQIHFKRDASRDNAAPIMANDDKIEVASSVTDFASQAAGESCK
jgi:hypothetical protein